VWCRIRHCGLPAFSVHSHGFSFLACQHDGTGCAFCNTACARYYKCPVRGSPPRHPAKRFTGPQFIAGPFTTNNRASADSCLGDHAESREMYYSGVTSAAAMLPLRGKNWFTWPGFFNLPCRFFNPRELQ
jgi:hypothetical protein